MPCPICDVVMQSAAPCPVCREPPLPASPLTVNNPVFDLRFLFQTLMNEAAKGNGDLSQICTGALIWRVRVKLKPLGGGQQTRQVASSPSGRQHQQRASV